jgi:hypothetical protein
VSPLRVLFFESLHKTEDSMASDIFLSASPGTHLDIVKYAHLSTGKTGCSSALASTSGLGSDF